MEVCSQMLEKQSIHLMVGRLPSQLVQGLKYVSKVFKRIGKLANIGLPKAWQIIHRRTQSGNSFGMRHRPARYGTGVKAQGETVQWVLDDMAFFTGSIHAGHAALICFCWTPSCEGKERYCHKQLLEETGTLPRWHHFLFSILRESSA